MNIIFRPTNPKERISQIDILRGFALFGILLVNVFGYNSSFFDFSDFYKTFEDTLNSTVFDLVIGFGADKFIFIFSFLFGVGFSIMYLKYYDDERAFSRLYLRRLLVLIMYSYGFGYFGSLQPWQLLIFAIVVFVIQLIFSKIWLQNFRFGPLEWAWRKSTYLMNGRNKIVDQQTLQEQ